MTRVSRDRWLGVERRHLQALQAVAHEGSFQRAADSLGYVQSAISQQIAHLEKLAGARLVARSRGGGRVAVTAAGQLLLEHAAEVMARLGAAREELAALGDGRAGDLRLGAIESVAARVLPHALPTFTRAFPDVGVRVSEAHTERALLALLDGGELDLGFCALPLAAERYDHVELFDDPYVLVAPARSALADAEQPPPLEEIARLPLIGFNRSRAQDHVMSVLAEHGLHPRVAHGTDLNSTIQALVGAGLGVAIVPLLCADRRHPDTVVRELPQIPPRTIAAYWPKDRPPVPPARRLVEAARDAAAPVSVSGSTVCHEYLGD